MGQLDGTRVLDLGIWRPAPFATQLLSELGADVLKIEPPGGDPMRQYPTTFRNLSFHKRSVVLDLKTDAGRERARSLAAQADVVIEGFRPGVVERLGMGYDDVRAVNPTVVYCSLSGYGQEGPLRAVPGHDANYMSWAGAPPAITLPVADLAGGTYAALAICAALLARTRTGEGEYIDVSMTDVVATWATGDNENTTAEPRAEGEPRPKIPHYGLFTTADGKEVTIGIISETHFWDGLIRALDLPETWLGLDFGARQKRSAELEPPIRAAILRHDRAELVPLLERHGVPVAPVLSPAEVLEAEHYRIRGTAVDAPDGRPALVHPVRYRNRPARDAGPIPGVGEHTETGWGSP
jgi:crotonobetainyl-CoA:carnitine CoA-transferase CaiB-like acyl-CoA transferase